jgi:hypothetical protein
MGRELPYSRLVATAERLGEDAEDRHRFLGKSVLLTGETATLLTSNGVEIASAALRLLVRMCQNVSVALPDDCPALKRGLQDVAREAALNPVAFLEGEPQHDQFDAILSIGTQARPGLPWTVVNSNGWRSRVSSENTHLATNFGKYNPIGAMGAACLGVADVFKRLIRLRPEKGELLDGLSFSFWSYSVEGDDPGPDLPLGLSVDLLLVGAGAIGNGIAYLLNLLPIRGHMTVIDRQEYGDENWGTSICLPATPPHGPKADFIAEVLCSKFETVPRHADIAVVAEEFGKTLPFPHVVLNGLDRIDARHEVQRLWPDLIIDGAIGSDLSCQVSCHPWGPDTACLLCLFQQPPGENAEAVQSRATGLNQAALADLEAPLAQAEVDGADDAKKTWLAARVGQKKCSVVSEAVTEILSSDRNRAGFSPSVPFVACFSAAMIVTELVRYLTENKTVPEPRYQLNLLWGPHRGIDYPEVRRQQCLCVERAKIIEQVRSARRLRQTAKV